MTRSHHTIKSDLPEMLSYYTV